MADKKTIRNNGAMKKGVAYWQTDWVKRVLSNGHNPQAKLLFMRIASFGERGCWMNNDTFSEEFNKSASTIKRAIHSLWEKDDIIVTGWNGYGRRIYASGHPKVREELNRGFYEAVEKGQVKTNEEYLVKIRYRTKTANP